MEISLEISQKELEVIKEMAGQMNQLAVLERKLPVLRFKDAKNGYVTIQLNENRGAEGLDLLDKLLRRLERFQKPSWP